MMWTASGYIYTPLYVNACMVNAAAGQLLPAQPGLQDQKTPALAQAAGTSTA